MTCQAFIRSTPFNLILAIPGLVVKGEEKVKIPKKEIVSSNPIASWPESKQN
jgi:hypothetical protein